MGSTLKNRILELFEKGFSYNEISKKLRCSKGTISFHCSKFIDNKFSEEKIKLYQEYYNTGFNLKETAKNFNVSPQALSKRLVLRKLNSLQIKQRRIKRVNNYRSKIKEKSIIYKGGKCLICGYNKTNKALEFHHLNPLEKDFTISGGTKSFNSIKKELDKCILVCSNCHREIHDHMHPEINPLPDTQ